jgi:nitroreductase
MKLLINIKSNKMKATIICLAIAGIFATSCNTAKKAENKEKTEANTTVVDTKTVVLQNIHNRKSVRNYVPRKMISKEDLTTLVRAGMAAPSAVNKQPWEFLVISDSAVLNTHSEKYPNQDMLKTAGGAILVCGNSERFLEGEARDFWVQDCSAATQNILLAAEAMGLGAVWTGIYPNTTRVKQKQEEYGLPENIIPLCLIIIGYPEGVQTPKDKWKEDYLHWNKY